jgi:hypothetical protein
MPTLCLLFVQDIFPVLTLPPARAEYPAGASIMVQSCAAPIDKNR